MCISHFCHILLDFELTKLYYFFTVPSSPPPNQTGVQLDGSSFFTAFCSEYKTAQQSGGSLITGGHSLSTLRATVSQPRWSQSLHTGGHCLSTLEATVSQPLEATVSQPG